MEELPNEILEEILQYLPTYREWIFLSRTCRFFHQYITEERWVIDKTLLGTNKRHGVFSHAHIYADEDDIRYYRGGLIVKSIKYKKGKICNRVTFGSRATSKEEIFENRRLVQIIYRDLNQHISITTCYSNGVKTKVEKIGPENSFEVEIWNYTRDKRKLVVIADQLCVPSARDAEAYTYSISKDHLLKHKSITKGRVVKCIHYYPPTDACTTIIYDYTCDEKKPTLTYIHS